LTRLIVDHALKTQLDSEGRLDPLLHESFEVGNEIAQCPSCHSWMLWQSWQDLNGACACSYRLDGAARIDLRARPTQQGGDAEVGQGVGNFIAGIWVLGRRLLARRPLAATAVLILALLIGVSIARQTITGLGTNIGGPRDTVCQRERVRIQQLLASGNLRELIAQRSELQCRELSSVLEAAIVSLNSKARIEEDSLAYQRARGNLSQLRRYLETCQVCTYKAAAQEEIGQLERSQLAERERQNYNAARGDLGRLRAYVTSCQVCTFKSAAQGEIARLERAARSQEEQRQYLAARGNIDLLRAYVRDCQICTHEAAARTEIQHLEEEEERRRNPTVIFNIQSNHPNSVELEFYSSIDKTRRWPGSNRVYALRDSAVHTYRLSCQPGENVCFGAWVEGSGLNPYWGSGYRGRQSCRNCCLSCPSGNASTIVLEPSDARTPTPTLTWNITKEFFGTLALAFYSTSRRGHAWPGGNQVYVIDDQSTRSYNLTCTRGETICYGAWLHGAPGGIYWGVGPQGRNGCANCCATCNGGEYNSTLTMSR